MNGNGHSLSAPLVPLAPFVRFEWKPGVLLEGRPYQQGSEIVVIGRITMDIGPVEGMFKMSIDTYMAGLQKAQQKLDQMREQERLSALTHSRISGMLGGFYPRQLRR